MSYNNSFNLFVTFSKFKCFYSITSKVTFAYISLTASTSTVLYIATTPEPSAGLVFLPELLVLKSRYMYDPLLVYLKCSLDCLT